MGKNDQWDFFDKELISFVQANECLYNPKMKNICTPAMVEHMWLQLREMLFQSNIPILDPKKRWNQLRTNFIRNHANGKTNWHLYDHLSFLVGTYNSKKSRAKRESPYLVNTSGCLPGGFPGNSSGSSSSSNVGKCGHTSQAVGLLQPDSEEYSAVNSTLPNTFTNSVNTTKIEILEETVENLEKKPFLKYELLSIPEEVIFLDEDNDVPENLVSERASLHRASPSRQLVQSDSLLNDTSAVYDVQFALQNESSTSSFHESRNDASNKENINFFTQEPLAVVVPDGREVHEFRMNIGVEEVLRDTMNRRKSSGQSNDLSARSNLHSGGFGKSTAALRNPLHTPGTSHQGNIKAVKTFASCPVSGRFKRVAEIGDERTRSNTATKDPPSKRSKSRVIVPPLDKFAQDKKVQQKNSKDTPVQQAIISSADDVHTTTAYITALMKLKIEVLKKQLTEKEEKLPNHVQLVEGDSLFNLFRHQWLQLTEQHQSDLFCEALDVMERFE